MNTRHAHKRRKRAGMTLVEVTIAGALTALIMGSIGAAALSGQRTARANMVATELELEARRMLDRIARQVIEAGSLGFSPNPAPPFLTTEVDPHRGGGCGCRPSRGARVG